MSNIAKIYLFFSLLLYSFYTDNLLHAQWDNKQNNSINMLELTKKTHSIKNSSIDLDFKKMLNSPNEKTRARAVELLAKAEFEKVSLEIGKMLFDPSPIVRETVINVLSQRNDYEIVLCFIELYKEFGANYLTQLSKDLNELNLRTCDDFVQILSDKNAPNENRCAAAFFLGEARYLKSCQILISIVNENTNKTLSIVSAHALAKIRCPELTSDLYNLTFHNIPEVRWACFYGLTQLPTPSALRYIEKIAIDSNQQDKELRRQATLALGALGDEQTINVLMNIMYKEPFLRKTAAQALQKLTKLPFKGSAYEWYNWYQMYRETKEKPTVLPPPPLVPRDLFVPAVPPGFEPSSPVLIEKLPEEENRN